MVGRHKGKVGVVSFLPSCTVEREIVFGTVEKGKVIVGCPVLNCLSVWVILTVSPESVVTVKVTNNDCRLVASVRILGPLERSWRGLVDGHDGKSSGLNLEDFQSIGRDVLAAHDGGFVASINGAAMDWAPMVYDQVHAWYARRVQVLVCLLET